MPRGLYKSGPGANPLTPGEREEHDSDLIAFCDRELDLLGDISGFDVLYAGGSSILWLEGLSQRVGPTGSLTALEADPERVQEAGERMQEVDLAAPVRLIVGDVFEPPFDPGAFDLAYSAGLFHELDVGERPAEDALAALARTVHPGGRSATSDFVNTHPAVQLEDEELDRRLAHETSGAELYGIDSPRRLVALHESLLGNVEWSVLPPFYIRHLDRLILREDEPPGNRRKALLERVRREGYTRPATLYVESLRPTEG